LLTTTSYLTMRLWLIATYRPDKKGCNKRSALHHSPSKTSYPLFLKQPDQARPFEKFPRRILLQCTSLAAPAWRLTVQCAFGFLLTTNSYQLTATN